MTITPRSYAVADINWIADTAKTRPFDLSKPISHPSNRARIIPGSYRLYIALLGVPAVSRKNWPSKVVQVSRP